MPDQEMIDRVAKAIQDKFSNGTIVDKALRISDHAQLLGG